MLYLLRTVRYPFLSQSQNMIFFCEMMFGQTPHWFITPNISKKSLMSPLQLAIHACHSEDAIRQQSEQNCIHDGITTVC